MRIGVKALYLQSNLILYVDEISVTHGVVLIRT